MNAKVFVDTNILVYAFGTKKAPFPNPRIEAAELIVMTGGAISVQVLDEFAHVCSRKAHLGWDRITGLLQVIKELCHPVVPITIETHEAAVNISRRYGFSIYDSLILAAAKRAGCSTVFSEDLQHGQVVEGVRIENPFRLSATP
jgi:predicted nucleic acid-binding protein